MTMIFNYHTRLTLYITPNAICDVISIDRISFTGVHFVRDVYIEGKIYIFAAC
jgi:hypothetical protein